MRRAIFAFTVLALAVLFSGAMAEAQENVISRSEISFLGTGDFTKSTTGKSIKQAATNAGGFEVGYRYHLNRLLAIEGNYVRTRNTQVFGAGILGRVQTNVHAVTASAVLTSPVSILGLKPYLLGGAGALIFDPTNNGLDVVTGASTQTRPTFVYGGGLDFTVLPHIAIRGEYRGFAVKAPNFGLATLDTGSWTHIAQPALGVAIRF